LPNLVTPAGNVFNKQRRTNKLKQKQRKDEKGKSRLKKGDQISFVKKIAQE
jgi:hypothetical protein